MRWGHQGSACIMILEPGLRHWWLQPADMHSCQWQPILLVDVIMSIERVAIVNRYKEWLPKTTWHRRMRNKGVRSVESGEENLQFCLTGAANLKCCRVA